MSAEELAHLQERFDIHVMAFADRSPHTAVALQQAFGLDSVGVERLLAAAPLVVKRGAPPDVAHALLDVLVPLGAQVVLLPAPPGGPAVSPPPGGSAQAVEPGAAAWGGLDIVPAVARRAALSASLPPQPEDREFDLSPGESDHDDLVEQDEPVANGDAASEPPGHADLGLGDVPPLPALSSLFPGSRPLAASPLPSSLPPLRQPPVPQVSRPVSSRRSEAPALPAGPPPVPILSKPPPPLPRLPAPPPIGTLPSSEPRRRRPPRSPARPAVSLPAARTLIAAGAGLRAPPAQAAAARGQRMFEPAPAPAIAPLELAHGPKRRDAPRARRIAELEPPKLAAGGASLTQPAPLVDPAPAARDRPPQPAPASPAGGAETRSRGLAALELAAGIAVIYVGLRLDDTVLHGNASPASLVLHALAFYALGAGLAGLRP